MSKRQRTGIVIVVRVVHYIALCEKFTIRFRGFLQDRFGNGVDQCESALLACDSKVKLSSTRDERNERNSKKTLAFYPLAIKQHL